MCSACRLDQSAMHARVIKSMWQSGQSGICMWLTGGVWLVVSWECRLCDHLVLRHRGRERHGRIWQRRKREPGTDPGHQRRCHCSCTHTSPLGVISLQGGVSSSVEGDLQAGYKFTMRVFHHLGLTREVDQQPNSFASLECFIELCHICNFLYPFP